MPKNMPRIVVTPTPEEDAKRRALVDTYNDELYQQNNTFAMLSLKLNELSKNNYEMNDTHKSYTDDVGRQADISNEIDNVFEEKSSEEEYETDESADTDDEIDDVRKSNRSLPAIRSVTNIAVYDEEEDDDNEEDNNETDLVFQTNQVFDYDHNHDRRSHLHTNYLDAPQCDDMIDSLSVIYEEDEMSTRGRARTESRASSVSSRCSTTIIQNGSDSDADRETINNENVSENLVTVRLPLRLSFSRSSNDEDVTTLVVGQSEVKNESGVKLNDLMSSNSLGSNQENDLNVTFNMRRSHSQSVDRNSSTDLDKYRNSVDYDDNCSEVSFSLSLPSKGKRLSDEEKQISSNDQSREEFKVSVRDRIAIFNTPGDEPKTPVLNKRQSWPIYMGNKIDDSDSEPEEVEATFNLKLNTKTDSLKSPQATDNKFVSNIEENILPFRERLAAFESKNNKRHSEIYLRNDPWDSDCSDNEPEDEEIKPPRPKTPEEYVMASRPAGWLTPTITSCPIKYEKFEQTATAECATPAYSTNFTYNSNEQPAVEPNEISPIYENYGAEYSSQVPINNSEFVFNTSDTLLERRHSIKDRIAAFEVPISSSYSETTNRESKERSLSKEPPEIPIRGRAPSREPSGNNTTRDRGSSRERSVSALRDRASSRERSITVAKDRAPSRDRSFTTRDRAPSREHSFTSKDRAASRGPLIVPCRDRESSIERTRERALSRERSITARDYASYTAPSISAKDRESSTERSVAETRERALSREKSFTIRDYATSTMPLISATERELSTEPTYNISRDGSTPSRVSSHIPYREFSKERSVINSKEPEDAPNSNAINSLLTHSVNDSKLCKNINNKKTETDIPTQKPMQDESEIDEDDSGVTSDINRPISETDDTESECFPELRKLTRYQRAATHSRLFKLLQEFDDKDDTDDTDDYSKISNKYQDTTPCDSPIFFTRPKKIVHNVSVTRKMNPDALKHAETMAERRERLSLQLKPSTSIDTDNLSSPSSPTPSINDKLVEELVQSVLRQQKLQNIKHIPMEKIHAAARKALQDETDSGDNTCSSSFESTPAITPQEFKDDCDYDSDTWNGDERRTSADILPSKAFKNLQEQSMYGRKRKLWAARCPRVLSSKTVNRDLSQVAEMPEQCSPEPHSYSPYSCRSSRSPMFNV